MTRTQTHGIWVRSCGWILLLAVLYGAPAGATLFSTSTKLTGSDSVPGDQAGYAVAVSADNQTLIFAAPAGTVKSVASAGEVYVFARGTGGTWTQQAALTEPSPQAGDFFGASVALSADGNTAVVGVPDATVNGQSAAGKAYIFTRSGSTWSEQTSFSDPTPTASDQFGTYVAVSGDAQTLLVGAPFVSVNSQSKAGTVFAYSKSNGSWGAPTKLTASDAAATSYFGAVSLSSDGNTALIGARGAGKAYFFVYSNGSWSQSKEITDPGSSGDEFGSAVALSGDGSTAVIGAYYTTATAPPAPFGTGAGEAYIYVFDSGSWSLQQAIENPDNSNPSPYGLEDNFGYAVALSSDGNTALITADQIGAPAPIGKAFTFTRNAGTWTKVKEIDDPGQQSYDDFGVSGAVNSSGTTAFIGSFGGSGAHYVYVIDSTADLSLALTADHANIAPGQSLTYMLTATNNDTQVTATNATVSDTLPSGVTATSTTGGCTGTTGTVTCVDAALAPGATYQPSITITAPANSTGSPFNITDTATLTADQIDPNTANNSVSLPVIVLSGSGGSTPVASNGSVSTTENQAVNGTLSATGSGTLTFAIATKPDHGTATVSNAATGAFNYTPASGYSGSDSFTFTASNASGTSNTGTETVTVNASGGGSGSGSSGSSGGSSGGGAFGLIGLGLLGIFYGVRRRRVPAVP